ncbi:MAG: glycosyltransferase [Candidatus Limnocylindria bacterium]
MTDRDTPLPGDQLVGAPRDSLFLVWAERHRGTRSAWLAESLGVGDLRYLAPTRARGIGGAWRKYPLQAISSVRVLMAARPRALFVQSPPSFAAWLAALYGAITGAAVVIDSHSDAFERGIWTRPHWISRTVARVVTATIVTNDHWAKQIQGWHATAITVPSVPTTFEAGEPPPLDLGHNVAVVNTWARDEPIEEVLAAAELLPQVSFHITGRDDRVASLRGLVPGNVRFTGFLPEDRYHGLLRAADAVVCLTKRDYTMQNGACEALSHATPVVTSDWSVLRDYFDAGAAHVDNSAAGIAAGIQRVIDDLPGHRQAIRELRGRRMAEWAITRRTILELINGHLSGRKQASRRTSDAEVNS